MAATMQPEFDLRAELKQIQQVAELATQALDDEREGDLTRRIVELHTRAAACLHLVNTW